MWRYLRDSKGPEFDRWQTAYGSKTKILDDRWVVIELSSSGIKEYSAFGKAVRAIWGATTVAEPPAARENAPKAAPRTPVPITSHSKVG
jgi:hypothetical protein